MKYLFILFSFFFFSSLSAEIIQNVEYQLPKAAERWVIGNQLENEKGSTIVYTPAGVERQQAKEFFGVNANSLPSDSSHIKATLATVYPNMKIDFHIVEKTQDGLIYEWGAQENGVEKVHGFGRMFSSDKGTVLLEYQTEEISTISSARSTWLPVLHEAHRMERK